MSRNGQAAGKGGSAGNWAAVGLWAALIFAAIPFARAIQRGAEAWAGSGIHLGLVLILGAAGAAVACRRAWNSGAGRWPRLGAMAGIAAAAVWVLLTQLQTAAEALHFVEYGVLGILLFRALRPGLGDWLVYPAAALGAGLVAWVDEFLQWLTPERFFDYRDIRLNLLAAGLALAFIAWGVRPNGVGGRPGGRSVRRLCALVWAFLFVLGLSFSATPCRINALAARVPALGFLWNNRSVLSEYGYRHVLPDVGVLFSRLPLTELERRDREEGAAAGTVLRRERVTERPSDFRAAHPGCSEPLLREAGEHLIRRDHYFQAAWQYEQSNPGRLALHLRIAAGENRILEQLFPETLDGAGGRWPVARVEICGRHADPDRPYESPVGDHLITRVSEGQLWAGILALAGLTGWIRFRWGRRA